MFETTISPAYCDADPSRHINDATYPRWFEGARNPLFRFFIPDLEPSRWNLILRRMELDFVGECFYNFDVTIRTYVEAVGKTSFTVFQEAWQNGKIVATGRSVIVHFDLTSKTKLEISPEIRRQLEAHRK